ncbi:hypothetical protein D6829_02630 [Candidatus Pacearchaeota archaeon]|nr:MAG: hypothetical protein D6829_02630 [Candidatus Pacearchaeota archaeon]
MSNLVLKRGQVTIFVVVALVIVGAIAIYFVVKPSGKSAVSSEFKPVYDAYLSCIEDVARYGTKLLGDSAGYIEKPVFEPGSPFMPFSSELDFLGQGVPYWFYVSGNNLVREKVPTKEQMEEQLAEYIRERIEDCDFSSFEKEGFDVYATSGDVSVDIYDDGVKVFVDAPFKVFRGNQSTAILEHEVDFNSNLGKLYDEALMIYNAEKEQRFLENYAIDVVRLYAPVTGVEISCSPKFFSFDKIRKDISEGLSANIPAVKVRGTYYNEKPSNKYFVVDTGFEANHLVNFMYNPSWPTKIEIHGDEVAKPVGPQKGLGVLGFCFVPYHFVYDVAFPVMVQLYDGEDFFQFPIAVLISGNMPDNSRIVSTNRTSDACDYANKEIEVSTYDLSLNPVEASVSFKCADFSCELGETQLSGGKAVLKAKVPQCVNGFLFANAQGYAEGKQKISTNDKSDAILVLSKKHKLKLDLGEVERALVYFESDGYSAYASYPEQDSIELVDGYYNVSVYAYGNSSIVFPSSKKRTCVEVPEHGLAGFFGATREKCFEVEIPETKSEMALVGGGKSKEYLTEEQLKGDVLKISVPMFGEPQSLDELQKNYELMEDSLLIVRVE